jgi:hypothetical protein
MSECIRNGNVSEPYTCSSLRKVTRRSKNGGALLWLRERVSHREESLAVVEREPEQRKDIPTGAAICLVICAISLVVVLPMRPPMWLLDALAQALVAVALWISSNR